MKRRPPAPIAHATCPHCGSLVLAHLIASCWVLERERRKQEQADRMLGLERVAYPNSSTNAVRDYQRRAGVAFDQPARREIDIPLGAPYVHVVTTDTRGNVNEGFVGVQTAVASGLVTEAQVREAMEVKP